MPNPVNKLQFDASGAETVLAQITAALKAQNAAVTQLTNTYATFNTKGKLVGATIKGITDSGQNFEAFVKNTKRGLEVVQNQASQTEAALKRLQASQKAATGRAEFAKAQPDLFKAFQTPASISNIDRRQLDNLIRGSLRYVKTGDVSAKELENVLRLARSGNKQALPTEELERTRLKILQVIHEYEKLNSKVAGGSATAGLGAKRSKAANFAVNRVKDMFDFDKINPRRLEDVYQQINKIQNLLLTGKLDFGGFRRAVNAFRDGIQGPLKGAEETVRASLARIGRYADETAPSFDNLSVAVKALWVQLSYSTGQAMFDQFKEMSQHAAELQKDLALIRTLSQESKLTLDDWQAGIVNVSNKLGIANHEVAKSAYDLLSNQVTEGSDTFTMLETAGKFALASNSNLEDSVNLISSAIHAYRLSAADAEKISANFFTAIDLGRVKASDLANNLGRLATTMSSLAGDGMNALTETNAVLTVMTRQGIQPDTAQVLLTNVLQKLLHPTEELKAVYKELGVASGEMFVKTYGFIGALEKLQSVTGGSKAKLADFFNEIRSQQGGRILVDRIDEIKKDKEEFVKVMNDQSRSSNYQGAIKLATENYGQRFEQQSQELANWFTTTFENRVLKVVLNLTDKMGGLANVVKTVGVAAAGLAAFGTLRVAVSLTNGLITGQGALAAAVLSVSKAGLAMTAAFFANPLTWIAAGIAAIVALGIYAGKVSGEFANWPEEIRKATEEQKRLNLAALEKQLTEEHNAFRDQAQGNQNAYLKYLAAYAQELTKVRDKQHEVAEEARSNLANALEVVMSNARKVGSELEGAMTRASEAAKEAAKSMSQLLNENVDRWTQRATKRNDVNMSNARTYAELTGQDPEVAANEMDRSDEIFRQQLEFARKRSQVAFNSGDLNATMESFHSINQILDQMASATRKVPVQGAPGKYYEQFKYDPQQSESAITEEYQRQLSLLDQIRKRKQADAELARQQLEVNKNLVAAMQDLASKMSKFNPFDRQGNLKDEYKDASSALKELISLQNKFNEAAGKMRGTQEGNVESYKTFGEQMEKVKDSMSKYHAAIGSEMDTERWQTRTMAAQDKITGATDAATRANALNYDTAKRAGMAYQNAWQQYRQGAQLALQYQTTTFDNSLGGRLARGPVGSWFSGRPKNAALPPTEALQQMDTAAQNGNFIEARARLKEYENMLRQMNALQNQMRAPDSEGKGGATAEQVIQQIRAQFSVMEEAARTQQESMQNFKGQRSGLPETNALLQQLEGKFGDLGTAAESFSLKLKGGLDSVSTDLQSLIGLAEQASAALNNMQGQARATQESVQSAIKSMPSSVQSTKTEEAPSGYRLGGLVYARDGFLGDFLGGKFARGSDTIPIMAARGEMVMNTTASRRFAPQLVAMNRGIDPARHKSAGSITHVGGIHVTVQGGPTDKHSVNNIVNGINRAARRGMVKLGGDS